MRKIRAIFTITAGLAMLMATGFADIVTLSTGERIECKVVEDNDKAVTVEVQVSAGITDQRVIPKAQVSKVEKTAPDEEVWKSLRALRTGANSLGAGQYAPMIEALRKFVVQFPASLHAADVQQALTGLEAEKKRVDAGEAKIGGRWLSRVEVEKEKVQIGGALAFEYMKIQAAAGDSVGALNLLGVIEKSYPGAKVVPDAVDLGKQLLVALQPTVDRALENQKLMKAERERGFKDAGPADRADLIAAYQREVAQWEAAVAAAERAAKWPPLITGSEKSLTALKAKIPTELQRLSALPTAKMRQSAQLAEKAREQILSRDLAAATGTLKEAAALWPVNELATRLQADLAKPKEEPKIEAAPPALASVSTTPKPGALETPMPANTVAAAATPAASKPAPPASKPAPATAERATPPPTAARETSADEPSQPVEEKKPFFMTLGGALTIVIVLAAILGGATLFQKMRKRPDDTVP